MFLHEFKYGLNDIKGIGKKNLEKLNGLNVSSMGDLIEYFPRKYEDRQTLQNFPSEHFELECEFMTICTILQHVYFGHGLKKNLKLIAETESKEKFEILLFNRSFLSNLFTVGSKFYIHAKFIYNKFNNIWTCSNFDCEPFTEHPNRFKKIISIYYSSSVLNSKQISKYIVEALELFFKFGKDDIPEFLKSKYNVLSLFEALNEIHFPTSLVKLELARKTLVYRELFLLQIFSRRKNAVILDRKKKELPLTLRRKTINDLPFKLTDDQIKVIDEIYGDLASTKPMNRLLQGDVGSGKTLVALLSALPLIEIGYQIAFMAPTDLLARQHYNNIRKLCTSISISLLIGNLKKSEKIEVLDRIKKGQTYLVIGTHAIFAYNVEFKNLAYIIIDEQHKFGVEQRDNLKNKGTLVDILLMSSTPIPRSLALTLFDDLEVSVLKTMPQGRLPVVTYLSKHGNEQKVYDFLNKELVKKHQIYFVYPLINKSNKLDLKDVTSMYNKLQTIFIKYNVKMIHSKLQDSLKEEIMNDFYLRKIDILVATSVIEVGIDCKNATCIVIEHAERFGLSTLHQIRGRVGRSNLQSYLFLLYKEPLTETAKFRLKTMKEFTDGFRIAEEDLKLRGPGNLFGVEQTGYLKLKIADFIKDKEILILMRREVDSLIKNKLLYTVSDVELVNKLLNSYLSYGRN